MNQDELPWWKYEGIPRSYARTDWKKYEREKHVAEITLSIHGPAGQQTFPEQDRSLRRCMKEDELPWWMKNIRYERIPYRKREVV
jgi:hypothetical protein